MRGCVQLELFVCKGGSQHCSNVPPSSPAWPIGDRGGRGQGDPRHNKLNRIETSPARISVDRFGHSTTWALHDVDDVPPAMKTRHSVAPSHLRERMHATRCHAAMSAPSQIHAAYPGAALKTTNRDRPSRRKSSNIGCVQRWLCGALSRKSSGDTASVGPDIRTFGDSLKARICARVDMLPPQVWRGV